MQVVVKIENGIFSNGEFLMSLKDAAVLADVLGRAKAIEARYIGHTYNAEDRRQIVNKVGVTIETNIKGEHITREQFDAEEAKVLAEREAAQKAQEAMEGVREVAERV
jgi:hypothetical protein